jgi:hypothetical protein
MKPAKAAKYVVPILASLEDLKVPDQIAILTVAVHDTQRFDPRSCHSRR